MRKAKRDAAGISRRVCKACGTTFTYPEVNSTATRKYCAGCASLPAAVRGTFEQLTRRINLLEKQIQSRRATPRGPDES